MSDPTSQIDTDLYAAAEALGPSYGRSVAQQVEHWMRVGRELESAGGIDHAAVDRVLADEASYDDLGQVEQVLVRGAWDARVAATRAALPPPATVPKQRSESAPVTADLLD